MKKQTRFGNHVPFKEDIPLELHSWVYAILALSGWVLISWLIQVGAGWAIAASFCIMSLSHAAWRTRILAVMAKTYLVKSFFGFLIDIFKKKSLQSAIEDLCTVDENFEAEVESLIQRESRWLVVIPILLIIPTSILHLLFNALGVTPFLDKTFHVNLSYFCITESYFFIVGIFWMIMCRRGRLTVLGLVDSDTE